MIAARRAAVHAAFDRASKAHPGLLLQRGLAAHDDRAGQGDSQAKQKDKHELLKRVADVPAGSLYAAAYAAWRSGLERQVNLHAAEMRVTGRLIVGLGNESVLEAGLTLHHTYGTPLIPGSALKGLTRHYAERLWRGRSDAGLYRQTLFGDTSAAGFLIYHDAWYVPGSADADCPLALDTITTHHQGYYTGNAARSEPSDFDDPIPVGFLSARGRYLVAIEGPNAAWAAFALDLLIAALGRTGAGGKTGAGYGRLDEHARVLPPPPPPPHPLIAEIDAIPGARIKSSLGNYAQRWQSLDNPHDRRTVAEAIARKLAEMNDPRWVREKAWAAAIFSYLNQQPS